MCLRKSKVQDVKSALHHVVLAPWRAPASSGTRGRRGWHQLHHDCREGAISRGKVVASDSDVELMDVDINVQLLAGPGDGDVGGEEGDEL